MNRAKLDQVMAVVSAVLDPHGFECIEAEWHIHSHILCLFVDRAGGINLDGCAEASRLLSDVAELDALIPGTYTLEVSSPGVERPLRRRSHFEQHIGAVVDVRLAEKVLDRRRGVGRLLAVSNDEQITIDTSQGPWSFPLSRLQKASLVYDWGGE